MRHIALVLLALWLPRPVAAETTRTEAAGLRFNVPKSWTRVPAPSDVRAAQYTIPKAAGDPEDGEFILFFFGKGKGGGVEDNLERWYGQFAQPDGKASKDVAVVTIRTVNGLHVTTVDLSGTYTAMMGPGQKAEPKAGYRMIGAIIEGDEGPWFVKATGPLATIDAARHDIDTLLQSVEAHR
jgi:hypothetical protein